MKGVMKVAMVIALIAIALFALGGVALAGPGGQNGPATPTVGDPVGSDVSPHGGYSSSTNFCLQCHAVHSAAGPYALMAQASVTATCRTCHALFGTAATGRIDPSFPGVTLTIGTAALRTAYDVTGGSLKAQHALGALNPPAPDDGIVVTEADWVYGAFAPKGTATSCVPTDPNYAGQGYCGPKATTPSGAGTSGTLSDGGLYCASCHTPHGEFGQLVNSKYYRTTAGGHTLDQVQTWANDAPIAVGTATQYLYKSGTVWQKCTGLGGTGTCTNLTTTDSLGETGIYLYGYKLLTAYPNHNYGQPESWGMDSFTHDQARWCGTCHPSKVSSNFGAAFTYHNHPTGCTSCHGIPNTAQNPALPASFDFPHTSTVADFLRNYPDALCIGCHTAGSLP